MATSSRTVDVHPQMVQGSKWVYVGDVLGVGKHLRNLSQLVGSLSKRDGRRLPCASVRVLEPHPGEQRGDVVSQADWRSWKYETRTITRHIATPPLRLRNGPCLQDTAGGIAIKAGHALAAHVGLRTPGDAFLFVALAVVDAALMRPREPSISAVGAACGGVVPDAAGRAVASNAKRRPRSYG